MQPYEGEIKTEITINIRAEYAAYEETPGSRLEPSTQEEAEITAICFEYENYKGEKECVVLPDIIFRHLPDEIIDQLEKEALKDAAENKRHDLMPEAERKYDEMKEDGRI